MDPQGSKGHGRDYDDGPSTRAIAAARRWLLAEFADEREHLLDELVATAAVRRVEDDAADAGLLRTGLGEVFDMLAGCAADSCALTAGEIAFFERLGAARCGQGAELEVVLAEFRTCFDLCCARLSDLAGDPPVPASATALRQLTTSLHGLRDLALEAIADGHACCARRLTVSSAGKQAGLLQALLAGNRRRLATERTRHGLAANRQAGLLLAVAETATTPERLQALLEPLLADALWASAAVVAYSPSPHVALLAPAEAAEPAALSEIRRRLADRLRLYALPAGPLARLAEGYQQLAPRLELADTLADGHGVLCRHRLATYQLLATVPPAQAHGFVAASLGPVLARTRAECARLLETLGAFSEADSIEDTAQRVGYHRRTIERHLSRVAELTGLDARQSAARQQLALAVGLWRLHRSRLPPPGDPVWSRSEHYAH